MRTHTEKSADEQAQAERAGAKKRGDAAAVQFEDQRPAALAQRQLKQAADASPQVKQLQAAQQASDRKLTPGAAPAPVQNANRTGLPDGLKTGIETLSGHSLDDVKVHYNSPRPAQLQALAYAQGADIHMGPGQEKHLPHEAWHVVQQKQGRVKPGAQRQGVAINADQSLEHEADRMGAQALSAAGDAGAQLNPGVQLRRNPADGPVAQLKPITVSVTGITHLVAMSGGSVMEGREYLEVGERDTLLIDTEVKYRSRRGPNQEIYGESDEEGPQVYRWFKVLQVNGKPVPENIFIRDETFVAESPELLGGRPAKLDPTQRDRVTPEEEPLFVIAGEIVGRAAAIAPQDGAMRRLVETWKSLKKPGHDVMKTYKLMQVCYALSVHPRIAVLLKDEAGVIKVKRIVAIVAGIIGRQIIQAWSSDPADDIAKRGEAWTFFCDGVEYLSKRQDQLNTYFSNCLEHDKGYGQTHASASEYLLFTVESGGGVEDSFVDVLRRALNEHSNTNIWDGGQAGSGKLSDQLTRAVETEIMKSRKPVVQEDMMWSRIVTAVIDAKNPVQKEWAYAAIIQKNAATLFETVRRLVPTTFPLSMDRLEDALSLFG